jgi:hypothetical protein
VDADREPDSIKQNVRFDNGVKIALPFVLFHRRLYCLLANSLFHHRPGHIDFQPHSRFEKARHKADGSLRQSFNL